MKLLYNEAEKKIQLEPKEWVPNNHRRPSNNIHDGADKTAFEIMVPFTSKEDIDLSGERAVMLAERERSCVVLTERRAST